MGKLAIVLTPLLVLALVIGTIGCDEGENGTPTPAPTLSPSPTPTVSPTPTPSPTPTDEVALPQLQVHYIDVGQGDSILLDLGEVEVLIDGGDRSPGVVAYLEDYVDGPLEAMIATHPHADHIGGLIAVLDAFEVESIWLNGDTSTSKTYRDFMEGAKAEDAEVREARRGDAIMVDGLTFDVLHPGALVDDTNNNSIVLALSYGDIDFLFTGDAEREAEGSMLVQSVVPIPDIDILKVGHHGSRTSSSEAFLGIIQPEVAIYMAETGNRYGHPHAETISALQDVGAEVYGTDIHGTIVVVTDGEEYTLELEKEAPPPAVTPTPTPAATPTPTPAATPTPTPAATPTPTPTLTPTPTDESPVPSNLGLPYAIQDLDLEHGTSHPFGIVRSSLDSGIGHPGIDLQPVTNAEILAMADGIIAKIREDLRFSGYSEIILQIGNSEWGITYESLILEERIAVGQSVSKGEALGVFEGGYALNPALIHVDLRPYAGANFSGYAGEAVCWINQLDAESKERLELAWDTAKVTDEFIESWNTATMEEKLFLMGLLDSNIYPDGPQMCYPMGTDVRE